VIPDRQRHRKSLIARNSHSAKESELSYVLASTQLMFGGIYKSIRRNGSFRIVSVIAMDEARRILLLVILSSCSGPSLQTFLPKK
jgi:hypothetical protein